MIIIISIISIAALVMACIAFSRTFKNKRERYKSMKNKEYFSRDDIKKLIKKTTKKDFKLSKGWKTFNNSLKNYLKNNNLDLYRINNIQPEVFSWPESSGANIKQLKILEKNKESIFYKTILKTNNYGPKGILLHKNVQLDRVQQVWSIYNLVNVLNLNLENNEIIFEFGGGTGQMADVLSDLKFKGKHIVYDLPLMTILQKYFINKQNIKTNHVLDDEKFNLINGVNYLPCNQIIREKYILRLPNINFIATYSLTETDKETHDKFAKYIPNFARIFIIYHPGKDSPHSDYIDDEAYIQKIKKNIEKTHYCYIGNNFGNGKVFMAVKKELMPHGILPPPEY